MQHNRKPFLLLGTTSEGNKTVSLTGVDFERHKWIQGITGSGKSTFLAWIAVSLLRQGIAFTLIDPHGDLCRFILSLLAQSDFFSNPQAFQKLLFVDFNRTDAAIAMNVLKQPYDSHTIANNLLEAVHRAFPTTGATTMLDNVFLAATYVLAENGKPLTDLQHLLLDVSYREQLLKRITDPLIVQFFDTKLADKVNSQLIDSTLRRSFLLTFSPALRNALAQRENRLNFRALVDSQTSCLFSLGGLDDQSKRLLGCLLMVGLEQAFLSRANVSPDRRFPYHVIVDEFPLFAASGDSFSIILEQVRKYKGTLYLANQTYSQLSKGLVGSLQNALPIIMKAGTDDSSALASRFFRPTQEEDNSFFDFLGFGENIPSAFSGVRNMQEAKMIFETLLRQEALVTIGQEVRRIVTPTLPIKTDAKKLKNIEDMYALRLLTPLRQLQAVPSLTALPVVPSPVSPLSRRVKTPGPDTEPIVLTTGVLETDIMLSLFHFHYMTLQQIVKLLQKENSSNYVREKLHKFVTDGFIETLTLPRSSAGKPPMVYYLTTKGHTKIAAMFGLPVPIPSGARKHQFLEHTLDCNELLLAAVQLPRSEPALRLHDMKHERTLKISPVTVAPGRSVIPDGFVEFRTGGNEAIGICFEIDRNTENKEKIQDKVKDYGAFVQGPYQKAFRLENVTVAFLVTTGGPGRVSSLLQWAKEILDRTQNAQALFLFGAVSVNTFSSALFLDPVFVSVDTTPHALIEKPF